MTQLLIYVPVIHAGYQSFLARHALPEVEVLVVGRSFGQDYPVIRKEIRALDPIQVLGWLRTIGLISRGRVVERDELAEAVAPGVLILPDEDLMRQLVATYQLATQAEVRFERTFLRWDREWSRAGIPPRWDGLVTDDNYARQMQSIGAEAAEHSSDWWRQVGAVAVRDGTILAVDYNRHLPSEYAPYIDGDPRNDFRRGIEMERTTSIHAEAAIITRAAREGFSLRGADLHVGTFPCPACSRLIAEAGFARCFFAGGYSVLRGDEVMQTAGVELVFVDTSAASTVQPEAAPDAAPLSSSSG
ncbi:CMP/dCMP-type deaminase domain-containing protein [Frankia sp. Hr75.2]|nr:CMP/dCMP-type deaminase domain-containing protein [Frankia sp. Hr75.2]